MPTYSYGADSPLKIELTPEQADAYNRVTQSFSDAQLKFMEDNNRHWTPTDPIKFQSITDEDLSVYNKVANRVSEAIKIFGRPISEEELMEDFLVQN